MLLQRTVPFGRFGLVALLLCWAALARATSEAGDPQRGLLFAFERGGGPPSYLFGTIHSDDPRVLDLPAPAMEAFASSRRLVLEVTPDAPTLLEAAAETMLPPGDDLETLVGEDLYREAVTAAERRKVPALVVGRLKPWAVATFLSLPVMDHERVLDLTLYSRALARGLPVSGLESPAEQLAAFHALSPAQQVALLRDVLRNEADLPNQYGELIDAYLSRDLATLAGLAAEAMGAGSGYPAFGRALVGERNERMAERIDRLARNQGGLFVAVGALHLPGSDGLVQLLRRRGFTVRLVY